MNNLPDLVLIVIFSSNNYLAYFDENLQSYIQPWSKSVWNFLCLRIFNIFPACASFLPLLIPRFLLRPIYTKGLAPRACSRGTLLEQSSFMCINDFMGIIDPREQNFHPAKCSMILNRLNIREQDLQGANWANLKMLPCEYWHFFVACGLDSKCTTLTYQISQFVHP